MIHYGTIRYYKPLSPGCELGAFKSLSPPHSSGETKTGIPPEPTPSKEQRSDRCQGREAGPEPRAAAGEHGKDLPLDSRRERSCYAPRRLRDVSVLGLPSGSGRSVAESAAPRAPHVRPRTPRSKERPKGGLCAALSPTAKGIVERKLTRMQVCEIFPAHRSSDSETGLP